MQDGRRPLPLARARHLELSGQPYDQRYDIGRYPSIAMNNQKVIVEVVQKSTLACTSTCTLSYRVGKLDKRGDAQGGSCQRQQSEIKWTNRQQDNAERIPYAVGQYPRVAINDCGTVVVVHQKDGQCFYSIGKMKGEDDTIMGEDDTISWCRKEPTPRGVAMATSMPIVERSTAQLLQDHPSSKPSVALKSDRDEAIVTFENNSKVYYCIGKRMECWQDSESNQPPTMTWTSPKTVPDLCGPVTNLCISQNSEGTIAVTYQRRFRFKLYFAYGTIDEKGDLQWKHRGERSFGYGSSPVVSINSKGFFIVESQSLIWRKTKFWKGNVKSIPQNAPFPASAENEAREERINFGFGCNPTTAINDDNEVVEVHETTCALVRMRNSVFYRSGCLKTN